MQYVSVFFSGVNKLRKSVIRLVAKFAQLLARSAGWVLAHLKYRFCLSSILIGFDLLSERAIREKETGTT